MRHCRIRISFHNKKKIRLRIKNKKAADAVDDEDGTDGRKMRDEESFGESEENGGAGR